MFGFTALPMAVAALALFTPASSLVVPRKAAPAGWWTEGLESYDVYHTRYLALNCQSQHNTEFFDACCHPMLATENLVDNREPQCTPSAQASSSASAAEPTSTVDTGVEGTDEDEDLEWECDDDEEYEDDDSEEYYSEPITTEEAAPAPTSTEEATSTSTKKTETTSTKEETTPTKEADPTTTEQATPTSEDTPEPTETSGNDNSGSGAYGGEITFYSQGGVAGACGDVHSDYDDIAAVSFNMYGNIGAKSALCGQKLLITNPANDKSVTVTVADACQSCADNHIDLSTGAFNKIADADLGLVDITIKWL